jgi:hypothetical protein
MAYKRLGLAMMLLAAYLWLAAGAVAQAPPMPPGAVVYAPVAPASLAVTAVSGRVAVPQNTQALRDTYPVLLLHNNGIADLFFNLGDNTVTAATTNYFLPAGGCTSVWLGHPSGAWNTNIAAITASGTTTLRVTGVNGGPNFSCPGAAGGGGGSVTVTPAQLTPLGNCRLASLAAATLISTCSGGIPAGALLAFIVADAGTANLRYRDDGTSPTASIGIELSSGGNFTYRGSLSALSFIQEGTTPAAAALNIGFYK